MSAKITLEELKEYIFNKNIRFLCNTWYCGNEDGFCPRYDCGCLDKLKSYTDRQWKNAMAYAVFNHSDWVSNIHDYAYVVVDYLWRHKGAKK